MEGEKKMCKVTAYVKCSVCQRETVHSINKSFTYGKCERCLTKHHINPEDVLPLEIS